MLNRDEFIRYWRARDRAEQGVRGGLFLAAYLAGMLLFALPLRFFDFDKQPLAAIIWFPAFFSYLIIMPLGWQRFTSGRARREFHRCPSCQSPLRAPNRFVVCATNRCGFCGETILSQ